MALFGPVSYAVILEAKEPITDCVRVRDEVRVRDKIRLRDEVRVRGSSCA